MAMASWGTMLVTRLSSNIVQECPSPNYIWTFSYHDARQQRIQDVA